MSYFLATVWEAIVRPAELPTNMAKKPRNSRVPPAASKEPREPQSKAAATNSAGGFLRFFNRELVESVVIAFVLAFLFRTFQAEAFVIPTGSMANTLVGRHKDVICPKCGLRYRAGASSEVDNETGDSREMPIVATQCPNCAYLANVAKGNAQGVHYPSYSGDRILVGKFSYESGVGEPERWDVAVFKFPGRATVNYIKRLVGLPGEELLIKNGDVYVKAAGGDYQIARKSHAKVRAMMQPVHDNDHVPVELHRAGWPLRWQSDPAGAAWKVSDDFRSYATDGPADKPAWLRYRHTLAGVRQWQDLEREGRTFDPADAPAYLITDSNAYNSSVAKHDFSDEFERRDDNNLGMPLSGLGMNWVSDLVLDCRLKVVAGAGQAIFELVDSGRPLRCTFDLSTGRATLSIAGVEDFAPAAETKVSGPGTFEIGFANFDRKLYLWVDGKPIEFDKPTEYPSLGDHIPTQADLAPVAIGAEDGANLEVSGLKIHRDIYYIAMEDKGERTYDDVDFMRTLDESGSPPQSRADFFSSPTFWRDNESLVRPHGNTDVFRNARAREFSIGEDKFFMLGDNSARSADGRLWKVENRGETPDMGHTVDRDLMIGKALFIYWPHSFNEIPGTSIPFPMFPNFGDMKLVR
jgi:signal peptidase I